MDAEYTDVMIDLETTGLLPDRAGILQIGAVKFNLKERTVSPDMFYKSLTLPPHRFWEQSTQQWWLKQKSGQLQGILQKAEPYRDVINQLADWGYQNPGLRMWAKPTHFDYMFLASYFADEGLPNPFHYRVARDLNTYLEGIFYPNEVPKAITDMPFTGEGSHDALSDAIHQLEVLFLAQDIKDGLKDVPTA
mgnify:CR=1 FL=1